MLNKHPFLLHQDINNVENQESALAQHFEVNYFGIIARLVCVLMKPRGEEQRRYAGIRKGGVVSLFIHHSGEIAASVESVVEIETHPTAVVAIVDSIPLLFRQSAVP